MRSSAPPRPTAVSASSSSLVVFRLKGSSPNCRGEYFDGAYVPWFPGVYFTNKARRPARTGDEVPIDALRLGGLVRYGSQHTQIQADGPVLNG
jgi:hypothetical protein